MKKGKNLSFGLTVVYMLMLLVCIVCDRDPEQYYFMVCKVIIVFTGLLDMMDYARTGSIRKRNFILLVLTIAFVGLTVARNYQV